MIEDGVMQNPKVDYVFGLHITNTKRSWEFGVREGPVMAASDCFKVRIVGKGGHGAYPHYSVDPIYVAAQVITALQGVSGRMIDPVQPFVVSVCSVHSGTKDNIIPDDALLEGTVRTLDEATRKNAKTKIEDVIGAVCKTYGAHARVEFMKDAYPVTINDPKTTRKVATLLKRIPGVRVKVSDQHLGGEDFSRFLQKAPGTFYFLGTRNAAKGCVHPNHSSKFKVDEDVLKLGAASLAMLADEFTKPKGP